MKTWFTDLSRREQIILISGAVVLVVFLFYLLAVRPLVHSHDRLAAEVESKQKNYTWMRDTTLKAKSLLAFASGVSANEKRTLIARVSAELATAGITAKQSTPVGSDRLKLVLNDISFVKLMERLENLQVRFGIRVIQATIEPVGTPGLVNARLTLSR